MKSKASLYSIALIGCITNNGLAMEQNIQKRSIRDIIEQQYPKAFNAPVMQVTEETIIAPKLIRVALTPSEFPDSLDGLEDHWQVIVCAEHRGKQKQVLINPYPEMNWNPNTLCWRSQKKKPTIYTIAQLRKAQNTQ